MVYVDGETDWLWMGVERIRLLITAGEELPRPDAVTLQQLANRCAGVKARLLAGLTERVSAGYVCVLQYC